MEKLTQEEIDCISSALINEMNYYATKITEMEDCPKMDDLEKIKKISAKAQKIHDIYFKLNSKKGEKSE